MIFHRKRKGSDPSIVPRQTQYNLPVELIFTVVPAIIVAVLFGFTVSVQNYVEDDPPNPDLKVDVTAFQWQWKFAYPGHAGRRRAADQHARHERHDPAAGAADGREHPVHPALQRRDPQLLHPGVPVQARRVPAAEGQRPGQRLDDRPDRPGGRVRRPLRRAVRQLPLADELRGQGDLEGQVRPVAAAARRRPTRRPARPTPPARRSARSTAASCARRTAYTTYPFTTNRTQRSPSEPIAAGS